MTIGVFTFEVHLRDSRSLKQKRQVLRRIKDRLRSRYNVAIAELEDLSDLWQRAGFVVVSVARRQTRLDQLFDSVRRDLEQIVPGEVVETGTEFLDGADAGPAGW